jgi:type I restriction enzyme S subunit
MIDKNTIPGHWDIKKIEDVCRKISLNKIKTRQKEYLSQGLFPVVDQGSELIGGYSNEPRFIIPEEPPYIIFGDHTKIKKFINFKFIAGADGVKVLKSSPNIDPKFLYYSLHIVKIPDKGYARHFQFLEKEEIPVPPLSEQHQIVSKIEELFSELDKGRQQLVTVKQQLKTYRQAVLKWAFEGQFTRDDFTKLNMSNDWQVLKLKDIVLEKEGLRRGPFGSAIKKDFFVPSGYKVYEQGNAINNDPYRGKYFIKEEKYQELKNFKVLPNDLIVSCSGVTLGRVCEIPEDAEAGIINQALLRIRLKKEIILNKYFIHYFRTAFFQKMIFDQSQGTAMPNLVGIKDFKEISVIVPKIEEQKEVISEIESRFSVCDKIEEIIETSLELSESLRQSILKQAFEGKLIKPKS